MCRAREKLLILLSTPVCSRARWGASALDMLFIAFQKPSLERESLVTRLVRVICSTAIRATMLRGRLVSQDCQLPVVREFQTRLSRQLNSTVMCEAQ